MPRRSLLDFCRNGRKPPRVVGSEGVQGGPKVRGRPGAFWARGCAVLLATTAGLCACGGETGQRSSSAPPSFAPPTNYPTGSDPESVAIGDLNGDGERDLAIANYGDGTVSVLVNRGDGSFREKRDYTTGGDYDLAISVAIGDLNGDGEQDLGTVNDDVPAGTVSVLLNKGDGIFQAGHHSRTESDAYSVAIGDLNGDGKSDLVNTNNGDNTVSVFISKGDGSLQAKVDYPSGGQPRKVAIGDLNGDGHPDLATANDDNSVSVLINKGDGSFRPKVDYPVGNQPFSVAIGDLNGDGKPDLATANFGENTVSVLVNNGDGSFRAKMDYPTGRVPASVAIGDLNGDGAPDLATANDTDSVSVLVNKGDGSFRAKVNYAITSEPASVAIGDLNGDGQPDLVIANDEGHDSVSVLINTPGRGAVQNGG
jgi:hypothetical protein